MKIHIVTASAAELWRAADCGLADGVLVSASVLEPSFGAPDLRSRALDFARLVDGPVFVSSGSRDAEVLCQEARELTRTSDQLIATSPLDVATPRDLLHSLTDRTLDVMLPDILARGRHRAAV